MQNSFLHIFYNFYAIQAMSLVRIPNLPKVTFKISKTIFFFKISRIKFFVMPGNIVKVYIWTIFCFVFTLRRHRILIFLGIRSTLSLFNFYLTNPLLNWFSRLPSRQQYIIFNCIKDVKYAQSFTKFVFSDLLKKKYFVKKQKNHLLWCHHHHISDSVITKLLDTTCQQKLKFG